jgi:hypothetical protein
LDYLDGLPTTAPSSPINWIPLSADAAVVEWIELSRWDNWLRRT